MRPAERSVNAIIGEKPVLHGLRLERGLRGFAATKLGVRKEQPRAATGRTAAVGLAFVTPAPNALAISCQSLLWEISPRPQDEEKTLACAPAHVSIPVTELFH